MKELKSGLPPLPALQEAARLDGEQAEKELAAAVDVAIKLLPAA